MRIQSPRRCQRGFTLVELLVVVGIIGVLIAMLFPALAKAREQANRIRCASNLRSIGQAMTAYVQHSGYYPQLVVSDSSPSVMVAGGLWPVQLRPFLGHAKDVFYCPAQDERCRWTESGPEPVITAPAGSRFLQLGYDLGEPIIHDRAYFSYGYNGRGGGRGKGLGMSPTIDILRASRVRASSEMVAVADSTADGMLDYWIRPHRESPYMLPGRVHRGGANVLYCDGHVVWLLQEQITYYGNESEAHPDISRLWSYDNNAGG